MGAAGQMRARIISLMNGNDPHTEKHPESTQGQAASERSSTAAFAVLVVVTFLTALYMKGLNSGIPLYYDSLGYSATIGGTFVAVFTLSSMAMRLAGGQITDHFPHYKVLLVSLAGLALGVAIPAICDEFYVVMASRILQGAAFALGTNVMTVAVMGTASLAHMGRRVGIKGAGTSAGTMLGALIATALLDGAGYHVFYLFYPAIMVLAIIMMVILHKRQAKLAKATPASKAAAKDAVPAKEQAQKADAPKASWKERARELIAPYLRVQVAPYMAISFARRMTKGFCIAFVLIFAKHAGIAAGAAFFVAAGATTMCCRLFGGKLFDSKKTWLLLPMISVEVIGFAALAIWPSFATMMVAAVGYGISVGTTSPFLKTLTAKATPREHWGVVNGELYFFGDLGKALGAFLGGVLIDALGKGLIPEIALAFSLFTSIATALALILGHKSKRKDEKGA